MDAHTWTPWRRGENASSAPALLLTALGEFVLPGGGTAWTSTLIDAMGVLDVEPKTARQAIGRTAAAGLLTSERVGRQVRWSLTAPATKLLTDGAERIYQFGRHPEPWDGRWLVVLVTVPETNRRLRYRLRVSLGWQGFASIGPGVWVSPWVAREATAASVLEELGLAAEALSFAAEPGALGALGERVYQAWDLAAVESEYQEFIEVTGAKAPATATDHFVDLVTLVHDWRHFPAADPGLPERLLPGPWPGRAAAEIFHDRHGRWRQDAWRWWHDHT